MSSIAIGNPVAEYQVNIIRAAPQTIVIDWFSDSELTAPKTGIDGAIFKMIVGEREDPIAVFTTIAVSSTSTFDLDEIDTNLIFDKYDGLITVQMNSVDVPVVGLSIQLGPS